MTTLSNMIDEVSMNLSGYTLVQDRATHLTAATTATASTIASPIILSVASTDNVGKGLIEIEEELIWVDTYDRVGNTATIPPYGRAYMGTTLAAHAAGTKVTISPTFPRFAIKRAINDTISALGASIFAANSTTITASPAVTAYRLPATGTTLNIRSILSLAFQTVGSSNEWYPIRKWRFDGNANSTSFTSGQTLSIYEALPPGRTIQVIYSADPVPFTANTEVFTTQTGLPESCKDVVVLGATYRLLSNLDPARASMVSPQADETDSRRPYGSSNSATKQIYALYNQRLNEEVKSQQEKYPIRIHYSI